MMKWVRGFWCGFVDEMSLKSKYNKEFGADTLLRWVISIGVFGIFYYLIYHYDSMAVSYDRWMHKTFEQTLSDVPSAAKVSWHRLAGGVLCGIGVAAATLDFSVSLYRRIRARIAASKTREEQSVEEDFPSITKP